MSETLGQKQRRFARAVARLLDQAHALGYEVTLGDAFRDPRVHGAMGVRASYSHPKGAHKIRLAIDLNLFQDVAFLAQSSAHQPLGAWWASPGDGPRWGGRFNDGNHYSIEHEGVK